MSKVYIVGPDYSVSRMFSTRGWEVVSDPNDADLIQFTGGSDISPSLYSQPAHPRTYPAPSRDDREIAVFKAFVGKKPMAGICRGGQLLWALNGGQLFQHVDNHSGKKHPLYSYDKEAFICNATSIHHQMMMETDCTLKNAKVLAFARESFNKEWMKDEESGIQSRRYDIPEDDLEAAVFINNKTLCFQPHPEAHGGEECADYYFSLIWNYLVNKG